jgi:hypothetical protein
MYAGCIAIALVVCAPADRPIVAEVFYDATGDDTGYEFVELYNPTDAPFALAGLRIEAGDGAGPNRWTLRWTGAARDTVAPRGRFVIGGARVDPPPGAVVTLDLQNGPDAMRLVWPDGATEVVGYGAQQFPEYACGESAPDVGSGQSLARIPDDSQRGSNALDFRASAPSPGRPNQVARDAVLIAGSLSLVPEQPRPGESVTLAGRASNYGSIAIASGEIAVAGETHGDFGDQTLFAEPLGAALAPGDTATFSIAIGHLPDGKQMLRVRLALAGDESPANDLDSLRVRAGEGPLAITEIQFHPAGGEGEWIEVRNRGGAPLDPARFTLSDRGTARGVPSAGTGALAPESLAVYAQDRAALLARFAHLDSARVWQASPWSSLNNTNDPAGIADAVVLRDADGTRCARVDYSASGVPGGTPLEWRDGAWLPSSAPGGTPLAPPLAAPAPAGHFELSPRRLQAGAGIARLGWSLPWPRARVTIEVYDFAGRRIARPVAESTTPARGVRDWPVAGLVPGLYLVALRARDEDGPGALTETRALRVVGAAP